MKYNLMVYEKIIFSDLFAITRVNSVYLTFWLEAIITELYVSLFLHSYSFRSENLWQTIAIYYVFN